jgi:hypothetical protein
MIGECSPLSEFFPAIFCTCCSDPEASHNYSNFVGISLISLYSYMLCRFSRMVGDLAIYLELDQTMSGRGLLGRAGRPGV